MSAFAKHGIEKLSPSSLNLWRALPSLWAMQYLGGYRSEDGPSAWRGKAVEDGMVAILRGSDGEGHAMQTFEANAMGEASDEIEDERKRIAPMIGQVRKWQPAAPLIATQLKVEHWFDGVPLPVIGYLDFVFEDGHIVDLKTTKACPSAPKRDHARQVALYRAARSNAPGSLLYVTDKRHECYPVGDNLAAECLAEMRRDALTLEAFLDRVDSAQDALHILPFDTDHFRIGETTRNAYNEMMGV